MIFGVFGPLTFARQVGVMHGFEESQSVNFAEHSIHLQKPMLEFVGPGLTEVSFEMDFLTGLTSAPTVGILLLSTLLKARRPYPLIVGARPVGSFASRFVLTDVGAAHHWYAGNGTIQNATVKVSLKEYAAITV